MFRSKTLIFLGWPIACLDTDSLSSSVRLFTRRLSSSCRLNLGAMLLRRQLASLKQAFRCMHPFLLYSVQYGHEHLLSFVLCDRFLSIDSWRTRLPTVLTLWFVLRHLAYEL